jgi:prepilin-type N-terminal cleavage/methylation domain-containing protein
MSTKKYQKYQGFTLIELLVVIAIIGILAGITLTAISTARANARNVVRKADLHSYELAQEMYYSTNLRYTEVSDITDGIGEACHVDYCTALSVTSGIHNYDESIFDPDWTSPPPNQVNPLQDILSAFPLDPLNGAYRCLTTGDRICIYAYAVNVKDYQKFALYTHLENGNRYLVCSKGYKIETTDLSPGPIRSCLGL